MGTDKPISYACDKGHKCEATAKALIQNHGCKFCMYENLAEIRTVKLYSFEPRTSKIKPGNYYVVPPPYNAYRAKYLGKGNWEIESSNGKMNPSLGASGHLYVGLVNNKKSRGFGLHQVVYAIKKNSWKFLKLIKKEMDIDHIDRNPANNRPKNLRLASASLQNRNRDVSFILDLNVLKNVYELRAKEKTYKYIAAEIGCSISAISDSLTGRSHHELVKQLPMNLVAKVQSMSKMQFRKKLRSSFREQK